MGAVNHNSLSREFPAVGLSKADHAPLGNRQQLSFYRVTRLKGASNLSIGVFSYVQRRPLKPTHCSNCRRRPAAERRPSP
jgi:hypothetical protein